MDDYRIAGPDDARAVASLHADSWRRHYRGAYADSYLDGDILSERLGVWSERLDAQAGDAVTILAQDAGGLAGFVHLIPDADSHWGSLLDNLHVRRDRQRTGVGGELVRRAAAAGIERAQNPAMYLWVQEQNVNAQRFYAALGGTFAEKALIEPPGGVPARLAGAPARLRVVWPDASVLAA